MELKQEAASWGAERSEARVWDYHTVWKFSTKAQKTTQGGAPKCGAWSPLRASGAEPCSVHLQSQTPEGQGRSDSITAAQGATPCASFAGFLPQSKREGLGSRPRAGVLPPFKPAQPAQGLGEAAPRLCPCPPLPWGSEDFPRCHCSCEGADSVTRCAPHWRRVGSFSRIAWGLGTVFPTPVAHDGDSPVTAQIPGAGGARGLGFPRCPGPQSQPRPVCRAGSCGARRPEASCRRTFGKWESLSLKRGFSDVPWLTIEVTH